MNQRAWITAALIASGLAAPVAAQEPPPEAVYRTIVDKMAAVERDGASQDAPQDAKKAREKMLAELEYKTQVLGEIRAKMTVEGRTTKGAPYSAEAVSESTQTLADGNRIVRKSVTRVYRDGEGRTRREDLNDTGVVRSISIVDPVAGTSVMLQPDTRTAYGNQPVFVTAGPAGSTTEFSGAGGRGRVMISADGLQGYTVTVSDEDAVKAKVAAEQKRLERQRGASDAPSTRPIPAGGGGRGGRGGVPVESAESGTTTREDLGRQNVEGVPATGSRVTTIIAAGAIGNEQPIKSVSEQWFSPDLQVLVMTKHTDPRQGDTIYRLANIVRAEPDRSLFIVPSDYTFKESGIRQRQEP